jgi:glycosyltransferase involved in cell wall biosynthesis
MIKEPYAPDTQRPSHLVGEGEPTQARPLLSVVAPVYNEETVLPEFHKRLTDVIGGLRSSAEIIYVNDGSDDKSLALLNELHAADPRVAVVNLSRNFGKDIALTAGLDYSRGEAVVVIDSDLQDPPEVIPDLIARWGDGYDVVYATRVARRGETFFKKFTAKYFYRLIEYMSRVEIPADTGDFRLLSRRAVDALGRLREHHRFMKGLFAWIGYPQISVPYERDPRFAGQSKWGYWKLWNFALEGITSFSTGPLKVATYVGLTTAIIAFLYAIWVVYKALRFGDPVAGYPSLMTTILFLGGVQLMTLGVIGEYLGRMFNETKHRPLYLVDRYWKPRSAKGESQPQKATGP